MKLLLLQLVFSKLMHKRHYSLFWECDLRCTDEVSSLWARPQGRPETWHDACRFHWSCRRCRRLDCCPRYPASSLESCTSANTKIILLRSISIKKNQSPNIRLSIVCLSIKRPKVGMTDIQRSTLQLHFPERKYLYFDSNLAEVYSEGSNWKYVGTN